MSEQIGKRRRRNKNKNKLCVVFDEQKRKDFLTGFRKRNLERKEKARENLNAKLKEEKKRIKTEVRNSYKKFVKTYKPISELENLFSDEFETEEATVKVVELSTDNIAEQNHWIGRNKPQVNEEKEQSDDSELSDVEELPGMHIKAKPDEKINKLDSSANLSKKEINKLMKKEALQKMKKSKVFQTKNKVERIKNKKKSILAERDKRKLNKHVKTKKQFGNKKGARKHK